MKDIKTTSNIIALFSQNWKTWEIGYANNPQRDLSHKQAKWIENYIAKGRGSGILSVDNGKKLISYRSRSHNSTFKGGFLTIVDVEAMENEHKQQEDAKKFIQDLVDKGIIPAFT